MHSLIRSIPAFKWLLVLPQLTSRMCHVQPDVQVGATSLQLTKTHIHTHAFLHSVYILSFGTWCSAMELAMVPCASVVSVLPAYAVM